jgi:phage terminase large subunit GpA-like protein
MVQALAPSPTTANPAANPFAEELQYFLVSARPPRHRTMEEFAEQEFIIPKGEFRGQRLRFSRAPHQRLFFHEVDSGKYSRFAVVGCVQSGKTLMAFVIPILYHIFELKETTICGIPQMDMGGDKWRAELLPSIKAASQFSRYLPTVGRGSRAGVSNLESIQFTNGAELKFMSGQGGDEKRSGYTSRVLAITEVDKMDESRESSRETDPISQMCSRLDSYTARKRRIYLECTVSIEQGRIWQEYQQGTASRLVCPCPHCGEYVTPEREQLRGWQICESKVEAQQKSFFCCPACGQTISEDDRRQMNLAAKLVHRGQSIDKDSVITGEPPLTDTLGFRWNAFNNLFWTPGDIGAEEWMAARAENLDESEKKMRQFYWCLPFIPPVIDLTPLDVHVLKKRTTAEKVGILPADTCCLTIGCDIGKWVNWWLAIATRPGPEGIGFRHQIVQYGSFEVDSKSHHPRDAILLSLRGFRDEIVATGWPLADGGVFRQPEQVWIDPRYYPDAVYAFCNESGDRFRAAEGCGTGQHHKRKYNEPTKTGAIVRKKGDGWHIVYRPEHRIFVVEADADAWKSRLHEALGVPLRDDGEPPAGSLTFYSDLNPNHHLALCQQFASEHGQEEFLPGVGYVVKWVVDNRRKTHLLDCGYRALAAVNMCGFRNLPQPKVTPRAAERPSGIARPLTSTMYPNHPFFISDRRV